MTKRPTTQDKFVYHRLRAFSRGLAHKIRTPLSVISNELSCFPPEEKLLSPKRCQDISQILRLIQLPNDDDYSTLPLKEFLSALELPCLAKSSELYIKASVKIFRSLLALLQVLHPNIKPELSLYNNSLRLTYQTPATQNLLINRFSSFTKYYCDTLGLDSFAPPLLDTALKYHAAQITIEHTNTVCITIEVPLNE